jgi:hypothetical protein
MQLSVSARSTPERGRRAAITLAVLAPIIAEVLMGSTRLSFIFVLIPEIMVWGCGALLAREAVRRWRGGWISLLTLGVALGVAEEFVIQQTSLAPLVGVDAAHAYGRFWGVNWVWMIALLVFEGIWVVLVPVKMAEAIFPESREEPWTTDRGLLYTGVIFAIGSRIAWYLWTQRARPVVFHVPVYHPPLLEVLTGGVVVVLLATVAFLLRRRGAAKREINRWTPPAWIIGPVAFLLAAPWFMVIGWSFGSMPNLPVWVAIASSITWAVAAFFLFVWWTSSSGWSNLHGLACACGALTASMVMGFLAGGWKRVDLIGKIVLDVAAVIAMIALLAKEHTREQSS